MKSEADLDAVLEVNAEANPIGNVLPGNLQPPATIGAPDQGADRKLRGRLSTFSSLKHRNYRLLWFGTLVSSSGDWMDQIALNWLMYQLTQSPVYLGILNFCRLTPILIFTLIGGVVADRVERRRLMFTSQTFAMFLALVLAILVSTGLVQVWMVLVIAVARGIMMSFNQPARQSLISELVPPHDLMNAIALNSATLNLTRVIGPTIGAGLIALVGVAGAFYFNAASFLAVLYGLSQMRFSERKPKGSRGGIFTDLSSGVKYLRGQPALKTLVLLAMLPMIFGVPYMTMLAVFADDVLRVGVSGYNLLMACSGLGAVSGALVLASQNNHRGRGMLMLLGLVCFGVSLIVFSFSPWVWLSVPMLLVVGVSNQAYMSVNNTLIQEYVEEEYRGRVLSTLFLNRGLVPLGTMIAGFGTAIWGVQATMGTMAATLVILALGVLRFAPAARDLN